MYSVLLKLGEHRQPRKLSVCVTADDHWKYITLISIVPSFLLFVPSFLLIVPSFGGKPLQLP